MLSEIYREYISDSNITEKNLMRLPGLRKNMKSCQIRDSSQVQVRKVIQFSETEEAANSDCSIKYSC